MDGGPKSRSPRSDPHSWKVAQEGGSVSRKDYTKERLQEKKKAFGFFKGVDALLDQLAEGIISVEEFRIKMNDEITVLNRKGGAFRGWNVPRRLKDVD